MQLLRFSAILLIALSANAQPSRPGAGVVQYVVDGDTLQVTGVGRHAPPPATPIGRDALP